MGFEVLHGHLLLSLGGGMDAARLAFPSYWCRIRVFVRLLLDLVRLLGRLLAFLVGADTFRQVTCPVIGAFLENKKQRIEICD